MTVAAFDTLKYTKQLKQAGIPEEQAEAQASALADALQSGMQKLATSEEVKNESGLLRQEMKSEFALVRQVMKNIEERLNGQMTLIKWMFGATFTGVIGIFIRLFFFRIV